MLRLHFTFEDLCKVTLNDAPPPLSEAVLALQTLTRTDQQLRFGPWRDGLRGRIPAAVRPLRDLVPARGWIPDFLTPVLRGTPGDAAAVEAVRATPARQIRADLTRLGTTTRLPGWVRRLADGDIDTMTAVTDALSTWNRIAVTPHEPRIQAALDADVAHKTTLLTHHGVDALLRQVHPAVSWQPPVLTVPSPIDTDIDLAGRGLRLAPMLFCGALPRLRLGDDTGSTAVLAYPLPFDPDTAHPLTGTRPERETRSAAALRRLLGGTRATLLQTIAAAPGLTTSDLARRTDVALATASEHATVLREAGLITSRRDGSRVRHYATTVAAALLRSR
ncbi:winged helix-turn-helix domain-containing protein [Kitasatospora paracochleata]|uniref:DNA-binding transcriptional ArsR family regulator n=1 Tax=Kitasatospora paracochleata TaxID=58354 RepID=A0ABT1JBG1_9ACTN|nr:helix-turn-helix domain-containing protein [Kitasatospora paracochleata]MCP2314569.1 DNA-binding transcriptional ArsR family regulator [Kitasatospora paracochleata]